MNIIWLFNLIEIFSQFFQNNYVVAVINDGCFDLAARNNKDLRKCNGINDTDDFNVCIHQAHLFVDDRSWSYDPPGGMI